MVCPSIATPPIREAGLEPSVWPPSVLRSSLHVSTDCTPRTGALVERLQLKEDSQVPTKYLASFCIVLLGPPSEASDDYSQSLIFHTINSTALPLESEHALKLILGQHPEYDMLPNKEFTFSPDLHFTRFLRDGLLKLPEPAQARLGNRPLTSLRGAVRVLMEIDPNIAKD